MIPATRFCNISMSMRKTILLLLFFIGICNYDLVALSDKEKYQDSLVNLIANESNTHQKIDLYQKLIMFFQKSDVNKSLEYCDTAISIAQKNNMSYELAEIQLKKLQCLTIKGNTEEISQILFDLEGQLTKLNSQLLWGMYFLEKNAVFFSLRDYASAMDNALRAVTFFEKCEDTLYLAKTYKNIGSIYDLTGNHRKALESYAIAQEYAQLIGAQVLLNDLYNNIGVVYDLLDDNDRALVFYFKALESSIKNPDEVGISSTFSNIASVLNEMNRNQEALVYFNKALQIDLKNNNKSELIVLYYNLGEYYYSLGYLDSAQVFYQKGIFLSEQINDLYSKMFGFDYLGQLLLKKNKPEEALVTYLDIYKNSQNKGFVELKEKSAIQLSESYKRLGNFKKAYEFQVIAFHLADSAREINRQEELDHSELQLEFKNQSRKYEKEIETYELTKLLEKKKIARERYFFIFIVASVILLAAIIYRSLMNSSKLNKKLVRQNKEIEEQKQLVEISNIEIKEQYTFTETLLNTIPNPVFYTDKNSIILGGNIAFEDITGRKMDEIIGINLTDLNIRSFLSCDTAKLFCNPGKDLLRNEGTMIFKDQKEHDVICYRKGIVNSENRLLGTLGIIIDITDIRKAERNLKFSQSKLKEALAAKDKFFNIMAHDLKNPFNAILGLTSLLSDNYEDYSPDESKQFVQLINQSANQVYSLLENLLEWARTQSGTIEKSPITFPINDIINESLSLFNHSLAQKKIHILFDESKEFLVFADKNMTCTIFRNLLSNAIKYSNQESTIEIELSDQRHQVQIAVIDSGIGIKPENLERIFKIDQHLSTLGSNNEKGTGLGLIICQEFVKQNGGKLIVQSEYGKGSVFKFTLPSV